MEQRLKIAKRNYILISLLGVLISTLGFITKADPATILGMAAYGGGAVMALCGQS